MSSFFVSLEVWENGHWAASRFNEFVSRVNTLCEELSKVAELWQKARDQYGEEFPAWSYGDTEVPASFRGLANSDLAKRVEKVQKTRWGRRSLGATIGASRGEFKSVFRDVSKLEPVFRDLAERVAKAQRDYAQQSALFGMRTGMRTSLQVASQLQATDAQAAVSSAQEEEVQREERERHRYAEEISRLLETLAAEVSHDDQTAIEQRVKEMAESPQASRRRVLLAQLHLDIQRANKAGKARQRKIQQVEQWRERLLGLEGTRGRTTGRSAAADCRWGRAAAAGHGAKGRRRRGAGDRGIQSRICVGRHNGRAGEFGLCGGGRL